MCALLSSQAAQININHGSHRRNSDLAAINVPVPTTPEAAIALRRATISVNAFLKKRIRETGSPICDKSVHKSCFDCVQKIIMEDIKVNLEQAAVVGGSSVRYAGQIGRAQLHLTRRDLPLLNACFDKHSNDIKRMLVGLNEAAIARFSMMANVSQPPAQVATGTGS